MRHQFRRGTASFCRSLLEDRNSRDKRRAGSGVIPRFHRESADGFGEAAQSPGASHPGRLPRAGHQGHDVAGDTESGSECAGCSATIQGVFTDVYDPKSRQVELSDPMIGVSAIPLSAVFERVILNEAPVFFGIAVPQSEECYQHFRRVDHDLPHLVVRDATERRVCGQW